MIPAANLFGVSRSTPRGTPGEAISASTVPGHCFAFRRGRGRLTIRLGSPEVDAPMGFIRVSHISLEHTSVVALPAAALTAPRQFRVLGWDADPATSSASLRPYVLVESAEFSVEPHAPTAQVFGVPAPGTTFPPPPVGWVTLDVISNHGGDHTCLYGLRVYQDLDGGVSKERGRR